MQYLVYFSDVTRASACVAPLLTSVFLNPDFGKAGRAARRVIEASLLYQPRCTNAAVVAVPGKCVAKSSLSYAV